jgi:hypothetical protein
MRIVGFATNRSKCPGVMSTNRRAIMRLRGIDPAEKFLAHREKGDVALKCWRLQSQKNENQH